MELNEALEAVRQHVMKTNKSAADAIRFMWGRLDMAEDEMDTLAQDGFRQKLTGLLRGGDQYEAPKDELRTVSLVRVQGTGQEMTTLRVSVILADTFLETDSGRKALVAFTTSDCQSYVNRQLDIEAGCRRHRQVMEHISKRLRACNKKTVGELGPGEQDIIARAWIDAKDGKETREFERFQPVLAGK